LFEGEDLIGRDRTGSGKTLAFSLPILERFRQEKSLSGEQDSRKRRGFGPKILILNPTRELANQTTTALEKLKNFPSEFKVISVYGGTSIERQVTELKNGVDIVVATPGRLIDLINRGAMRLRDLEVLVFDETDEMLKIGFQKDIETILEFIKNSRTTDNLQFLLFSATVPHWVSSVAKDFMSKNYYYINMIQNTGNQTSETIQHLRLRCFNFVNKMENMQSLVSKSMMEGGRSIIFTETKCKFERLTPSPGKPDQRRIFFPRKRRCPSRRHLSSTTRSNL
jgi:ATP-dependent RNA helicase DDX21